MKKKDNAKHAYAPRPDTEEILDSRFFSRAGKKAKKYITHPKKAADVIGKAVRKSVDLSDDGVVAGLKEGIQVLGRMLAAILRGDYKRLPSRSLVRVLAGLVYFLLLVDFIPDFIPMMGLIDDAMVVAWVVKGIREELDDFLVWERGVRG